MTALYAESSAVLRWLLGTPDAAALAGEIAAATEVVSSRLTSSEVGRTLQRLVATGQLDAGARAALWARYTRIAAHWTFHAITDDVLRRAGEAFPVEPLRTLDAIHVATAHGYATDVGPVRVLSVDDRVRENALALGLAVSPGAAP
jgi:predicted nucleic acid-binding protein